MANLSQVVALVKDRKAAALKLLTEVNKTLQKTALFDGLMRTYKPHDDNGERLPAERKNAQTSVTALVNSIRESLVTSINTVRTQDNGNCSAKADVVVTDGAMSFTLKDVPATHLLFLEHQVKDLETLVSNIPVLEPSETWIKNATTGVYQTDSTETVRTKKSPRVIEKAKATVEHPAQTELIYEDIAVGMWSAIKTSGAIPTLEKAAMLRRINLLREAIVKAREEANRSPVTFESMEGAQIVNFVFGA